MLYMTMAERIGIEKGILEGIEKGMQQGLKQGLLEAIELGLKLKFKTKGLKLFSEVSKINDKDAVETAKDLSKIEIMNLFFIRAS
ncbi:hypothetical protein [Hippea alviniae]|uniref:hypothetical protein n=1 Tax=Hippea alviniae TaxID=1279027 RepID=UPI0003B31424|nr:hypothetical protein [Hippea alviniae]